jgi:hypothetical protein
MAQRIDETGNPKNPTQTLIAPTASKAASHAGHS